MCYLHVNQLVAYKNRNGTGRGEYFQEQLEIYSDALSKKQIEEYRSTYEEEYDEQILDEIQKVWENRDR